MEVFIDLGGVIFGVLIGFVGLFGLRVLHLRLFLWCIMIGFLLRCIFYSGLYIWLGF